MRSKGPKITSPPRPFSELRIHPALREYLRPVPVLLVIRRPCVCWGGGTLAATITAANSRQHKSQPSIFAVAVRRRRGVRALLSYFVFSNPVFHFVSVTSYSTDRPPN